ncbi:glycosyltransferase [Candidatus Scalindua japonica]|nr:glycosyltransferase [Candidatus Scalindua japonica]
MEMFISAVKELGTLDMLFYVPSDIDTSKSAVAKFQQSLSSYWDVDIKLFLCPRVEHKERMTRWGLYGAGAFSFFKQLRSAGTSGLRQVQAFRDCLQRKPTSIIAHRLESICPLLLTNHTDIPVYFDLDDIEHVALIRNIGQPPRWMGKPLLYLQVPALWWGERRAIKMARKTFVCSEKDRNYLQNFWGLSGVRVVPNAAAIPKPLSHTNSQVLLFIGSYNYTPNVIAAEYLINKIWPYVYKAVPDARLLIAGTYPENISCFKTKIPGVEFTGFVDDLDKLYQQSRVICCPILSGGGTRLKIIEAAAYGKPVVSTTIGAEGIEMYDGRELLLRDDPASFAEACIDLLNSINLCNKLGSAAREVTIRNYDRNNVIRLIKQYITEVNE